MLASREREALCTLTRTLGCRIPYPATTMFLSGSMIAWFNGCASVPINRCAEPRGISVSASSVITNLTRSSSDRSPAFTGKLSYSALSRRFRSINLPRLRSIPSTPFRAGYRRGAGAASGTIHLFGGVLFVELFDQLEQRSTSG